MDQINPDFDFDLVERYFSGTLTVEETDAVNHWLQASPARQRLVRDLRAFWSSPEQLSAAQDLDTKAMWRNVVAQLKLTDDKRALPKNHARWSGWYRIVGVAAGVIAIVAGWHLGVLRLGSHPVTAMSTYVTANGQRANITLPDGSTVALDVASRLEVPADYLAGNHTLRLTGEALFSIDHHQGAPFTVISGLATARVLGTTFLVRHYRTDSATMVAVQAGRVAVGNAVLSARQLVEVSRTGMSPVRPAEPSQFSFVTGALTLTNTPLSTAIPELDRWYDVDIRLGDPAMSQWQLHGQFTAGSVADFAAILAMTFNVHVVRDGRVLTLLPRSR